MASNKKPKWLAGALVPQYNEARESFNKHLRLGKLQDKLWFGATMITLASQAVWIAPIGFMEALGMSASTAASVASDFRSLATVSSFAGLALGASVAIHSIRRRLAVSAAAKLPDLPLACAETLYPTAEKEHHDPFARLVAIKILKDKTLNELRPQIKMDALRVARKEREESKREKAAIKAAKGRRHAM